MTRKIHFIMGHWTSLTLILLCSALCPWLSLLVGWGVAILCCRLDGGKLTAIVKGMFFIWIVVWVCLLTVLVISFIVVVEKISTLCHCLLIDCSYTNHNHPQTTSWTHFHQFWFHINPALSQFCHHTLDLTTIYFQYLIFSKKRNQLCS